MLTLDVSIYLLYFHRVRFLVCCECMCCECVCHLVTANSLVPVSVHVATLAFIMFFTGVTLGGLDNGKYYTIVC